MCRRSERKNIRSSTWTESDSSEKEISEKEAIDCLKAKKGLFDDIIKQTDGEWDWLEEL
jgi:hypothetical protein